MGREFFQKKKKKKKRGIECVCCFGNFKRERDVQVCFSCMNGYYDELNEMNFSRNEVAIYFAVVSPSHEKQRVKHKKKLFFPSIYMCKEHCR